MHVFIQYDFTHTISIKFILIVEWSLSHNIAYSEKIHFKLTQSIEWAILLVYYLQETESKLINLYAGRGVFIASQLHQLVLDDVSLQNIVHFI